jgi:adenine-specific DNA-methyltransferase
MPKKPASETQIESFVHDDASRRNIPPAEFQTMVRNQEKTPIQVAYERRNPDLDPQLIWRGKDLLDESPLVVNAPPLYIQEKVHPKVLVDDLLRGLHLACVGFCGLRHADQVSDIRDRLRLGERLAGPADQC